MRRPEALAARCSTFAVIRVLGPMQQRLLRRAWDILLQTDNDTLRYDFINDYGVVEVITSKASSCATLP